MECKNDGAGETAVSQYSITPSPQHSNLKPGKRRLFRPTSVGMLTAGVTAMVGFAAFNTGNNLIYLLTSLLFSSLVVSVVVGWRSLRGLELSRTVPREIFAGEDATVSLKITNTRRRANAYVVAVLDGAASTRDRLTGRAVAARIEPGAVTRLSYTVTPPRRGEYLFGEAFLKSGYPFGLCTALRRFDLPDRMIVYPRIGRLSKELIRMGRSWGSDKIARSSKRLGSDEFYGIREYRPGDNPKHIHWRTSARLSKLILKEFERDEPLGYTLVLDSFADPGAPADSEAFEMAVSLTATLIDELAQHGARVFLIAALREETLIYNGDRSRISAHVLRELALIEPAQEEDKKRLRATLAEHAGASAHITAVVLDRHSPLHECLGPARSHGVHIDVIDVTDPRVIRGFDPKGRTIGVVE
ncbi:MAG: DUF58 domain-containing protein [Planctomycetes bacterium]|nr:DUF58 domain-containing protein [Planctomycetota bacterium]